MDLFIFMNAISMKRHTHLLEKQSITEGCFISVEKI